MRCYLFPRAYFLAVAGEAYLVSRKQTEKALFFRPALHARLAESAKRASRDMLHKEQASR